MLQDMDQWLQEEGLDSSASSDERLCLLWQLYRKSESTVRSLNQQIQDLQKERVAEIEKVSMAKEKTWRLVNCLVTCILFQIQVTFGLWNTKVDV